MGNTQYDYSQNDPRWRDEPLGFSTRWKIGNSGGNNSISGGCLITSAANVASNLGHPIDPREMNIRCKAAGLMDSNGDIIRNDFIEKLFPDIKYVEGKDWPREEVDLKYFDVKHDVNTEIIVKIDTKPDPGVQDHWLRVIGWDGYNDVLVVDPWDGKRKGLSAYAARHGKSVGRIIYRAWKYRRNVPAAPAPTPAPPPPPPQPAPAPTPAPPPPPPQPAPAPTPAPPITPQNSPVSPTPQTGPATTVRYKRLQVPVVLRYNKDAQVWDFGRTTAATLTAVAQVPKFGHFVAVGIAQTQFDGAFYMSEATFGQADKTGTPAKPVGVRVADVESAGEHVPQPVTQNAPEQGGNHPAQPNAQNTQHKPARKGKVDILQKITDAVAVLTSVGGVAGLLFGLVDDIVGFISAVTAFWSGRRSHHYLKRRR